MEIKITIKTHEDSGVELPVEIILETLDFDEKFKPLPNLSSENEFFENHEQSKKWIREKVNDILNKI